MQRREKRLARAENKHQQHQQRQLRAADIHPNDIDPDTGAPYEGYSSPSLDTSFHDMEMDVD